ncbi:hypothetical protein BpHYR1_017720 [Brachionus plicatilis]|uniref:Uncharacterized protein n=1 Tax=Brachionus plicatilis TaxID=10195 RepID=A0A3M7T1T9_BRAPC|nr:hypothetical protein BpHYR1_017720 [Brachionus plicatilis]
MILCGCFFLNTLTNPYETYAAPLLVSNRLELTYSAGSDYRVTYSAALRSIGEHLHYRFTVVAFSIVKKWSIERNPSTVNANVFQQNTKIKLSDWTNGYNWAKLNKQVIEKETENEIMYYLPAKDIT